MKKNKTTKTKKVKEHLNYAVFTVRNGMMSKNPYMNLTVNTFADAQRLCEDAKYFSHRRTIIAAIG